VEYIGGIILSSVAYKPSIGWQAAMVTSKAMKEKAASI
jgi:hypothetical protein